MTEVRADQRGSGPVFVITGASSGIGAATARQAAAAGYRLVLAARSRERVHALAEQLGGEQHALAVRCDVTRWTDQRSLLARASERFGRVDAVFANAGLGAPQGFSDGDVDLWREMVLTNVYGAALTVRAALPAIAESPGHIVFTGSFLGRRVLAGSLYSCTKWAVTAMAEAVRQEVHGSGVRVTLVEPGMTSTPFFAKFEAEPIRAALLPDDIARAVMYALSQPPHVDVNELLIRPTAEPG